MNTGASAGADAGTGAVTEDSDNAEAMQAVDPLLGAVIERVQHTLALLHQIKASEQEAADQLSEHQKLLQRAYEAFSQQKNQNLSTTTLSTIRREERAKAMSSLAHCFKEMVSQYESADRTLTHIRRLKRFEQVCISLIQEGHETEGHSSWAEEAQSIFVEKLRVRVKALAQERLSKHEYMQEDTRKPAARERWLHMHQHQRQRWHAVHVLQEAFMSLDDVSQKPRKQRSLHNKKKDSNSGWMQATVLRCHTLRHHHRTNSWNPTPDSKDRTGVQARPESIFDLVRESVANRQPRVYRHQIDVDNSFHHHRKHKDSELELEHAYDVEYDDGSCGREIPGQLIREAVHQGSSALKVGIRILVNVASDAPRQLSLGSFRRGVIKLMGYYRHGITSHRQHPLISDKSRTLKKVETPRKDGSHHFRYRRALTPLGGIDTTRSSDFDNLGAVEEKRIATLYRRCAGTPLLLLKELGLGNTFESHETMQSEEHSTNVVHAHAQTAPQKSEGMKRRDWDDRYRDRGGRLQLSEGPFDPKGRGERSLTPVALIELSRHIRYPQCRTLVQPPLLKYSGQGIWNADCVPRSARLPEMTLDENPEHVYGYTGHRWARARNAFFTFPGHGNDHKVGPRKQIVYPVASLAAVLNLTGKPLLGSATEARSAGTKTVLADEMAWTDNPDRVKKNAWVGGVPAKEERTSQQRATASEENDHRQQYFAAHDATITCLSVDASRLLVATGQSGKTPFVLVWSVHDRKVLAEVGVVPAEREMGPFVTPGGLMATQASTWESPRSRCFYSRGICAVGFSPDSKLLVAVGCDDRHTLGLWHWQSGNLLACVPTHTMTITSGSAGGGKDQDNKSAIGKGAYPQVHGIQWRVWRKQKAGEAKGTGARTDVIPNWLDVGEEREPLPNRPFALDFISFGGSASASGAHLKFWQYRPWVSVDHQYRWPEAPPPAVYADRRLLGRVGDYSKFLQPRQILCCTYNNSARTGGDEVRFALMGGDNGFIYVWHTAALVCINSFSAHRGPVGAIVVSPADGIVISGGEEDGMLIHWRLAKKRAALKLRSLNLRLMHPGHLGTRSFRDANTDVEKAEAGGKSLEEFIPSRPSAALPTLNSELNIAPWQRLPTRSHRLPGGYGKQKDRPGLYEKTKKADPVALYQNLKREELAWSSVSEDQDVQGADVAALPKPVPNLGVLHLDLDESDGSLLIATTRSSLICKQAGGAAAVVVEGHFGDVYTAAVTEGGLHSTEDSANQQEHPEEFRAILCTAGDDRQVFLWDTDHHRSIASIFVPELPRASCFSPGTVVTYHPDMPVHLQYCCDDQCHLSLGFAEGSVLILRLRELLRGATARAAAVPVAQSGAWIKNNSTTAPSESGTCSSNEGRRRRGRYVRHRSRQRSRPSKESRRAKNTSQAVSSEHDLSSIMISRCRLQISAIKYSPDGLLLAVASHDGYVDIYDARNLYRHKARCKGHTSAVLHVDWSTNSRLVQCDSSSGEIIYFDAYAGVGILPHDLKSPEAAAATVSFSASASSFECLSGQDHTFEIPEQDHAQEQPTAGRQRVTAGNGALSTPPIEPYVDRRHRKECQMQLSDDEEKGAFVQVLRNHTSVYEQVGASADWKSWSLVVGFPVMGIWPLSRGDWKHSGINSTSAGEGPGVNRSDILAVTRAHSGGTLATADTFGVVKLFNYPCVVAHAPFRGYCGHGSHVLTIQFAGKDDSHLISTGDSVFIWKVVQKRRD